MLIAVNADSNCSVDGNEALGSLVLIVLLTLKINMNDDSKISDIDCKLKAPTLLMN